MKGWTTDGTEVTLTPFQEATVATLLQRPATVVQRGRLNGWSTCIHTLKRLREDEQLRDEWVSEYERTRGRRLRVAVDADAASPQP